MANPARAIEVGPVAARRGRLHSRLSFPQKLIAAFALAISVPLIGYAVVMHAVNSARMALMDDAALEQRVAIAEEHLKATGLELLYATTAAAAESARQGDDASSPVPLAAAIAGLRASHGLAGACMVYANEGRPPQVLGEDLMLDAALGESAYAAAALDGGPTWGLLRYQDSVAVVAAAPLSGTGEKTLGAALIVAQTLGPDRLARVVGADACTAQVRAAMEGELVGVASVPPSNAAEGGVSGFHRSSLGSRHLDDFIVSTSVLQGMLSGSVPVLLDVAMKQSVLPGRGPRFVTVALCAIACALLLGALLTSLVSTWVSRPLDDLRARSEAIADGMTGQPPLELNTDDALGRLSQAFNHMVANLEDAQKKALHNERLAMAGKMSAAVAHEVKNVLAPIHLRAELLLQGVDDPAAREHLEGMRDEVSRGATLLRSLLEFARSGSNEYRAVAPGGVVERAAGLLEPQFNRSGCRLTLQDETSGALVWGDHAQLLQLVVNLLNNAVDAGARNVTATASVEGGRVRIGVRDDGVGMDDTTRDRALEPFFTTKPTGKGTGLGLSVCHSVVQAHGGTIDIDSSRTGGTRVLVLLPLLGAD